MLLNGGETAAAPIVIDVENTLKRMRATLRRGVGGHRSVDHGCDAVETTQDEQKHRPRASCNGDSKTTTIPLPPASGK